MASVIGILFFIVLLLALSITEQDSAAVANDESLSYQELLVIQQELQERICQIDNEITAVSEIANAGILGEDYCLEKLAKKKEEYENIQNINNSSMEDIEVLKKTHNQLEKELVYLTQSTVEKEVQLEQLKRLKGFSGINTNLIIDKTMTKTPVLIEVTDKKIRVAKASDIKTVIEFQSDDIGSILKWTRNFDSSKYYFVLLKKTSGVALSQELELYIKDHGFDVGTDLIPDEYVIY